MNNYTDESCEEGLYVDEAIEKIIEFGAKKMDFSNNKL